MTTLLIKKKKKTLENPLSGIRAKRFKLILTCAITCFVFWALFSVMNQVGHVKICSVLHSESKLMRIRGNWI